MIFAAGLGTRLKPLTDSRPKALVELNGKTLLQWQIEKLKNAGITDIIVNVHHFADMIIDYLREHDNFGCHITISDERDCLLDTGGGLRHIVESGEFRVESSSKVESLELIGEPILALNVDILSNIDIRALVAAYEQDGISRLVVSERKTSRYLLFDEKRHLVGWTNIVTGEVRPPVGPEPSLPERLAFSGMQILSPRVCARLLYRKEAVFSLIDFYLDICQKEILQAYVPEDYKMFDVGKFEHLSEAQAFASSL